MDPLTPLPSPETVSPPKPSFITRQRLIVGAVVLVGILTIIGVSFLIHPPKSSSNNDAYFDRPGYNRQQLSDGVGDPMALTLKPSNNVITTTKSGAIIPACSVISPETLKSAGLILSANPVANVISRTYFDGVGNAPIESSEYTLPLSDEGNNCNYFLENSAGDLTLDVYQPTLVTAGAIQDEINRRYTPAAIAGLNGVEVFKRTSSAPNTEAYLIRQGDVSLALRIRLKSDLSSKSAALMKAAVSNLASLKTKPTGASTPIYDSPTYKVAPLLACTLMNNSDIQSLTGHDASPLVTEKLATATGVHVFSSAGDDTAYTYIQNECTRANIGLGSGLVRGEDFNQTLTITTTSYNVVKGAEHVMADMGKDASSKVAVSGIGDEAVVYQNSVNESIFVFRKSRHVVELNFNNILQKNTNLNVPSVMAAKLTPFAKKAAGLIK